MDVQTSGWVISVTHVHDSSPWLMIESSPWLTIWFCMSHLHALKVLGRQKKTKKKRKKKQVLQIGLLNPNLSILKRLVAWYSILSKDVTFLTSSARHLTRETFVFLFIILEPRVEWYKSLCSSDSNRETASERRGNNLNGLKDFHLNATARTWPRMAHVCHIRSTANLLSLARRFERSDSQVMGPFRF